MSKNASETTVTEAHVVDLAKIAQIGLIDGEAEALAKDLTSILEDVAALEEISRMDIPIMVRPQDLTNVQRADETVNLLTQEEALSNAPEKESGMFKVPSILGGEM